MPEEKLLVMISSTSLDLQKHRREILDACQQIGMHAIRMEDLHAHDATAETASLDLVDKADIYLGIFAHRYGHMPKTNNPEKISVTEMEYNRAVKKGVPRVIFIIDESQRVLVKDVQTGSEAEKLKTFLSRVKDENIVKFFRSSKDLKAMAIRGLELAAKTLNTPFSQKNGGPDIPSPPQKYIAHTYTLLQTDNLIGRLKEIDLLNEWVDEPQSEVYKRNIFSFVAIGGLGKSALTWKWFNETAPEKMKPLAGRMWWSFYDSDAYFENFMLHALAYVSGNPIEDVRQILAPEREAKLLAALDQKPFLLVLDGFERALSACSRAAARLDYSEINGNHDLRKTIYSRGGRFLQKLAQVKASRILISTRIQPADLETNVGRPLPGVFKYNLESLPDNDAVRFWRELGVEGSRAVLLPFFHSFGKHTLLIQALAGEIMNYRRGPGDFDKWREANLRFDPAAYPEIVKQMAHVMEFALEGLNEKPLNALNTMAAFRMPISFETLEALLIGKKKIQCKNENELAEILKELEDRGLVGWDRPANRYHLHPIVRDAVWSGLCDKTKQGVYTTLRAHYGTKMTVVHKDIKHLDDLAPDIEFYNTLIGMGRYDDACDLFDKRLEKGTLYRLSASRQRLEMLEMFFPDGLNKPPRLSNPDDQAFILNSLAMSYQYSGEPERADRSYRRANEIYSEMGQDRSICICSSNLSNTLRMKGELREAEETALRALVIARDRGEAFLEAVSLYGVGLAQAARKEAGGSVALQRSLSIFSKISNHQREGAANTYWGQRALWLGKYEEALLFAKRAWELADIEKYERDFICAARVRGEGALGLNDFYAANEWLRNTLARAEAVNLVQEEVPSVIALAELGRRQADEKTAREWLDLVWEPVVQGPYPLLHADALNVLAQIERDAGNIEAAKEAATKAYELSWCDGPPYAYHWGLEKAKKHLTELEAPFPDMPEFDESNFEPMPDVEIDPDEEEEKGSRGGEEEKRSRRVDE